MLPVLFTSCPVFQNIYITEEDKGNKAWMNSACQVADYVVSKRQIWRHCQVFGSILPSTCYIVVSQWCQSMSPFHICWRNVTVSVNALQRAVELEQMWFLPKVEGIGKALGSLKACIPNVFIRALFSCLHICCIQTVWVVSNHGDKCRVRLRCTWSHSSLLRLWILWHKTPSTEDFTNEELLFVQSWQHCRQVTLVTFISC